MTIKRATTTILVISICFGVTGGLFGYALGVFAPAYYRGVFQAGNDLRFTRHKLGSAWVQLKDFSAVQQLVRLSCLPSLWTAQETERVNQSVFQKSISCRDRNVRSR